MNGVVHSATVDAVSNPPNYISHLPLSLPKSISHPILPPPFPAQFKPHQTNTLRPQPTYTQLSYIPPKCGNAPITLGGLSVTDNGFGVWNVTFPVTGGLPLNSAGKCTQTTTTIITAGTGNTNTETITTLVSEILAGGVPGPLGVGTVGTIPAVASKHIRGSSEARAE